MYPLYFLEKISCVHLICENKGNIFIGNILQMFDPTLSLPQFINTCIIYSKKIRNLKEIFYNKYSTDII